MLASWNVRKVAVNEANGDGRTYSLLDELRAKISQMRLQEARRHGKSEFTAAEFRLFCCGTNLVASTA